MATLPRLIFGAAYNYADTTEPAYVSSQIPAAGTTLIDTYNEAISPTITTTTGRTITMSPGGAVTCSSPVASGSTVTWTLSRTIGSTELCTANAYTAPGTGIKDMAGNYLATWNDADGSEVTNDSNVSTSSLLLDEVGSAALAVSTSRRLRAAYSGNCLRVRRASDNTEQDIGFSGDNLDTSAITTFCAGTDGFVVTLYDQSGNGRNITTATTGAQPKIVSSGSVETGSNGKPCMVLDGSDDVFNVSRTYSGPLTYFVVCSNTSTTNGDVIVSGNSNTRVALRQATGPKFEFNSGATLSGPAYTNGTWYIVGVDFVVSGDDGISVNNGAATTGSGGANTVTAYNIGHATLCAAAKISEWVVYESTLSSGDRSTVVTNMDAHFDTYT